MAAFDPPARPLTQETRLFINNEFVDAKTGKTFKTVNPATEEVICEVQEAGKEDVDDAVKAAKTAFKTWKKSNGCDRRDMLLKLAGLVEKHRTQLAELESTSTRQMASRMFEFLCVGIGRQVNLRHTTLIQISWLKLSRWLIGHWIVAW